MYVMPSCCPFERFINIIAPHSVPIMPMSSDIFVFLHQVIAIGLKTV